GALLEEYRRQGRRVRRVALVVGSLIDPARIGNDHIRAHALEGRLFRTALEGAVRAARLPCTTLVERSLYETAAARLKRPPGALRRAAPDWCSRAPASTSPTTSALVRSRNPRRGRSPRRRRSPAPNRSPRPTPSPLSAPRRKQTPATSEGTRSDPRGAGGCRGAAGGVS